MKSLILIGIDTTDARRMLGKAGNKDQSMEKALRYSPSLIAVPHGSTPLTNPEKMNTRATIHRDRAGQRACFFISYSLSVVHANVCNLFEE